MKSILKNKEITEMSDDAILVSKLVYHIENPCYTFVNGEKKDIRNFYIKETKEDYS
jgi:hypothetical protein